MDGKFSNSVCQLALMHRPEIFPLLKRRVQAGFGVQSIRSEIITTTTTTTTTTTIFFFFLACLNIGQ